MTTQQRTPDELVERVQELTERLESIPDAAAREAAEGLIAAVMELYGEGLERIVHALDEAGPDAAELRTAIVDDGVVASLLLIHGLYPVDLETRVQEALDGVRPYMHSHGGDVELLGIEDGIARLRLEGSCSGCPASSATLEQAIRQALEEAAPDLLGLDVEGVESPTRSPAVP
jgi:Fe-S cluster biogenesis protein NfuA/predicted transcriptional regulator